MARPVEYDKQLVLQKAVETFWLKGYEGTSVANLIEATGLNSRSMYNLFGSKNGLFKEAIRKYYEDGIKDPIESLKAGEGLVAVKRYIKAMTSSEPLNGCLFVNTLSEKTLIEPDCLKIVKDHFKNMELIFKEKLEFAKEHEGFSGDPGLRARQLVVMLQGISQYIKTGVPLSEMKGAIDDLLKMLKI